MSDMTEYLRALNEYHGELLNVAFLSAHMLDVSIDLNGDEWHRCGCCLMRDRLVELAERLPFPPSSVCDAGGGRRGATSRPASQTEDENGGLATEQDGSPMS